MKGVPLGLEKTKDQLTFLKATSSGEILN